MKRLPVVIVVAAALGAGTWLFLDRSGPPIPISKGDVTRISFAAFPEGPPAPAFVKTPTRFGAMPLSYLQSEIPTPLPGTLWQGIGCRVGATVNISLTDGRTVTYGPCRLPTSIATLRAAAFRLDDGPLLTIQKIAPYVYPEGTAPPPFEQVATYPTSLSLLSIADAIPSPLPQPLRQGTCRLGGGIIITTYTKTITYGPCRMPSSIEVLDQAMNAAWNQTPAGRSRLGAELWSMGPPRARTSRGLYDHPPDFSILLPAVLSTSQPAPKA